MCMKFNYQSILYIIVILNLLLLTACRTVKPNKPMERYEDLNEDFKISEINVPVSIDFGAMESEINTELGGTLYEDATDDYAIRAEKTANISLSLNGQELTYFVPLKLWVQKDMGITNVEAEGQVSMEFKTRFEINQDWNIETFTDLVAHEWVSKPRLKMGFVDIPVENIMSIVLKRSKATITKQIDDQIQSRLDLRYFIDEAWNTLQDPIAISADSKLWLEVAPQKISMSPLFSDGQIVTSTIFIATHANVVAGKKPKKNKENAQSELPPLEVNDNARSGFQLNMIADVPYEEASTLAKKYMVGETFEQGKYKVRIEDIVMYGSGKKLVIETDLSGSYKGKVYLQGIPHYNATKNQIEMKDVEYTLKTKNFLVKTMSWFFHKNFEKRIQKQLIFPLDKQFEEIKRQAANQLKDFKVNDNMRIEGVLDDIKIERTYLTPKSIRVQFVSNGDLDLFIDGLDN